MARAKMSVVVNRPIEEVFQFISDLENDPKWHPRCIESQKISDGPSGIGARYREVYRFMGKSEIVMEITEFVANRKIAFKGTPSGPMEPRDVIECEPLNGGTKITYTAEPKTRGLFKLIDPLFSLMTKSELKKILAELEPALESGGQVVT
jgi:uncharacterized protein YndB with AHSA1/START domain